MADPEPLSTLVREHPVNLPYCTDPQCCDPMERQEVADALAPFLPLDADMVRLLDRAHTCPRCLRQNGQHSIHCHRHYSPVAI